MVSTGASTPPEVSEPSATIWPDSLRTLIAAMSSAVRWRTKTGLPRHTTVTAEPAAMGDRSTSVLASASTSREGFMEEMNGQAAAPTPTAVKAAVVRVRKSRRVPPPPSGSAAGPCGGTCGAGCCAKVSAIPFSSLLPGPARAPTGAGGGPMRQPRRGRGRTWLDPRCPGAPRSI